jgi:hypothetical protein
LQTSQGYIIRILQHFATKLWNITNFLMLFQAVMKFLSRLVEFKILVNWGMVHSLTSSYTKRLKQLNQLLISYWFEIKDITFFYKCKAGYYDLTLEDYILDNPTNHHTRFSSTDAYRPNRYIFFPKPIFQ